MTYYLGLSIKMITLRKNYFFLNLIKQVISVAHPGCPPSLLIFAVLPLEFLDEPPSFLEVLSPVLFSLDKLVSVFFHSILVD